MPGTSTKTAHGCSFAKESRSRESTLVQWRPIEADLRSSPEDADEYVVLRVTSSQGPNVDFESYLSYCDEWSDTAPWPASSLIILDFYSFDTLCIR
jgi:hypothetical protein